MVRLFRPAPGKRPAPSADIGPERVNGPEEATVVFGDVPLFDDGIIPELAAPGPDFLVFSKFGNRLLGVSLCIVQEPETAY